MAVVASLFAAAAARADAQDSKVRLTTDKPVYKVGASDPVTVAVRNDGSQTVYVKMPSSWSVWKGDTLVYSPPLLMIYVQLLPVNPGQSFPYAVWKKKDSLGNEVAPGSYRIKSSAKSQSGAWVDLSIDVALTPSGKLAGTSRFPLAVGNQWVYEKPGPSFEPLGGPFETMKVTSHPPYTGWYKVKNLVGADRWAHMVGSSLPSLWVANDPDATSHPLFRFNRPLYYTYGVDVAPWLKNMQLKVLGTNETVVTPSGTFTGCYLLEDTIPMGIDNGHYAFWFAPGVGLVQYTRPWMIGSKIYRLHHAKVKGSDGKKYTIGLN